MKHVRIFNRTAIVAIDAQPMHLALALDLIFADHRDVVFRLTRDHAAVTSGAHRRINNHRPRVSFVVVFWIQAFVLFLGIRL